MAMTVFHSGKFDGLRCSTALAYLLPALGRPNLKVVSETQVSRIVFDGKTATGVECHGGVKYEGKEVILSAGAIQSPQLLQVSGIGEKEHLERINVPIVHENANIGQNLQDHLELYFQQECVKPVSFAPYLTNPLKKLGVGLKWIATRKGLGYSSTYL
jgi:choline dehydrogenase